MTDADRQRIAGRKWAEEAIEFALSEGKDFHEGFVRQIKRVYSADLARYDPNVMSEAEAIAFEAQTIAFGRYRGESYGTAPMEYIAWLADQNLPLARYVRSERFKAREE